MMRLIFRKQVACLGLVGLIVGCDGGDVAKVAPGPPPEVGEFTPRAKTRTRSAQRSTPTSATQLTPE